MLEKRPGIIPLLKLLDAHRRARKRARPLPRPAHLKALNTSAKAIEPHLNNGDLGWTEAETTIRSYLNAIEHLKTARDRRVAWANASALGEAVSRHLSAVGVHTPPVDPSAEPSAQ